MGKTFKSGERYGHIGVRSSKIPKQIQPKEIFIGCIVVKLSKIRDTQIRENLESSKTRKNHHIWRNLDMTISKLISRNITEIGIGIPGENGIIYPKYSEEKNQTNKQTTTKNTLPRKAIMKKWRRDRLSQTNKSWGNL